MIEQIVLILVMILINGYFAAAEIALISARKSALQQKVEEGSKGAKVALQLTGDPSSLLATIQIMITLAGMLASATAAVTLARPLQSWLAGLGSSFLATIAAGLSVFIVTLIISYVTLVLGELVPKQLGLQRADGVASAVSRPIAFFAAATRPVVWFLSSSTKVVGKLFGIDDAAGTQARVSEEEIKLMVDEQEDLNENEKRMITEIFELGDTVLREVMVPRVDIMFVEDTETVAVVAERLHARGYSRVPVFHEDHDRVIGILVLKDLVVPISEGKDDENITDFLHEPIFYPETKDLLSTLSEMQEGRYQMVIVVDEYGGTSGIVTMEDILEEVVGEIVDETDRELAAVREVEEGHWLVEGALDTEEAAELGFPVEESDEYDTLAGWLLEQLGHIPHVGEAWEADGYTFTVVAMRRRRISRIRVQAAPVVAAVRDEL
jgi:putative hemolysin